MTIVTAVWAAVIAGMRFAFQFNPVVAVLTAVIAAMASGRRTAGAYAVWRTGIVCALGWTVGDGLLIFSSADALAGTTSSLEAAGQSWTAWVLIAVWALGSFGIGYLAPALVGGTVGRRVTVGTGWLAAGAVAGTLVLAVSSAVGALS